MCLTIKQQFHVPAPKVVNFPIVVYKGLERVWYGVRGYYSPYRGFRYDMGKRYKTSFYVKHHFPHSAEFEVYAGFHACISRSKAQYHGSTVVYGIIPPRTKFYLGKNLDIVSEEIILYSSRASLERVWGKIGLGVPRSIL